MAKKKNKQYVVYGLYDCRTGEIRYVGQTNDVKRRIREHVQPKRLKSNTNKNKWLRDLLASGNKPKAIILLTSEDTPEWTAAKAERKVIAYMDLTYDNLTNTFGSYR